MVQRALGPPSAHWRRISGKMSCTGGQILVSWTSINCPRVPVSHAICARALRSFFLAKCPVVFAISYRVTPRPVRDQWEGFFLHVDKASSLPARDYGELFPTGVPACLPSTPLPLPTTHRNRPQRRWMLCHRALSCWQPCVDVFSCRSSQLGFGLGSPTSFFLLYCCLGY